MSKYKILVVDDDKINIMMATKMLESDYDVVGIMSGKEALAWLEANDVNLVLLDIHMPEMDGFEVFEKIRMIPGKSEIPIIFLTADDDSAVEVKGIEMGAFDYIKKPFIPTIARIRVNRCIEDRRLHHEMEAEVIKKTEQLKAKHRQVEAMSFEITRTLASTIDAKDTYTKGHSARVADYSVILAKALGWDENALLNLRYMCILHDIGKIGIPDQVLNKPKRLTPEEFDIIKSHSVTGSEILKGVKTLKGARTVARHHHERYDGLGYPDGLKGEDIPVEARICGIADAFDAMSSDRVYRKALPADVIRSELVKGRGTQFDPEMLDVFLKLYDNGELNYDDEKLSSNMEEIIADIDEFTESIYGDGTRPDRKNSFALICEHMRGLQAKYNNKVTVIVIAFKKGDSEFDEKELSDAMKAMEYGIVNTIRPSDICKRVGPERFMILLFESKSEDAGILVDKFLASFYRNSFSEDFKPYYKIADIGADEKKVKKTKIMVVDDNSMNLRVAEFALKDKYEVIKANSGEVALDVLPDSGVSLVLLDVLMPVMGGFETFDKIRQLEGFSDIPICFLTADTDEDAVEKMKELKAPYVNKPFEAEQLLSVVEELLK